MTLEEIHAIDKRGKNVLIIGEPASGKTWLSKQIEDFGHLTIHTDKYIKHGYVESLYALLQELMQDKTPTMVEGMLGYRLLRKGQETGQYRPDIVITVKSTPQKQAEIYNKERNPGKLKYMMSLKQGCDTILKEYLEDTPKDQLPKFITFENYY